MRLALFAVLLVSTVALGTDVNDIIPESLGTAASPHIAHPAASHLNSALLSLQDRPRTFKENSTIPLFILNTAWSFRSGGCCRASRAANYA